MKRALNLPLAVTLRAMCSIVDPVALWALQPRRLCTATWAEAQGFAHNVHTKTTGSAASHRSRDHRQRGRCRARLEHRLNHGLVDRIVPPEPLVGRHHLQACERQLLTLASAAADRVESRA